MATFINSSNQLVNRLLHSKNSSIVPSSYFLSFLTLRDTLNFRVP